MPKKKGKKRSMTEEEKARYMEMRAAAEEEERRRKMELVSTFLKYKLEKEKKNARLNQAKLNQQWRQLLRVSKCNELKKDLEALSSAFERVMDRKGTVIESLVHDLGEAEIQYYNLFTSHVENVDRLLELHSKRLDDLHEEYFNRKETVKQISSKEAVMLTELHKEDTEFLATTIYAMNRKYGDSEADGRAEFISKLDETKNKNMEEKQALRAQLEGTVEELWRHFQATLREYLESTEDRRKAYTELKGNDEKSSREIYRQMKKIHKLHEIIASLKGNLASKTDEQNDKISQIKYRRDELVVCFQDLRYRLDQEQADEKEQLVVLTSSANSTKEELKKLAEKGERILKLSGICRKYESAEEKVMPYSFTPAIELGDQRTDGEKLEGGGGGDGEEVKEDEEKHELDRKVDDMLYHYSNLETLWDRHNKVELENAALRAAWKQLMHENDQLKELLQRYLAGLSPRDDVPLLTVCRQSIPSPQPVSNKKFLPPVVSFVDGTQASKHVL